MANPDQKTILIDNAFKEIKYLYKSLRRYWYVEFKSLLKWLWTNEKKGGTGFALR